MRHRRHYRPPFDPSLDLVVTKPLKFSGVRFAVGEAFDKTLARDTRRLRQLYDARFVSHASGQESAPLRSGPKPGAVGPTDLYNPGRVGDPAPEKRDKKRGVVRRVVSRRRAA